MRKYLVSAILLFLTACGGGEEPAPRDVKTESSELRTFDVAEPPAAPDVGPTAAPGVAFNYRYAFRLPTQRVAAVQEQHAQACEKLGIARCRITGMLYRVVNERDIEARLAFKLEPSIARQFGKAGADAVTRADGMLIESEITGEDAGAAIRTASRSEAELAEDLRRIEGQLTQPRLPPEERARLQQEAQRLRDMIRSIRASREDQQESLANTPVVFEYGSGDLVPGFDTRSPMRDALQEAGDNFIGGIALLFVIFVSVIPWALLALLGWWLFTRVRRHVKSSAPAATSAPAT